MFTFRYALAACSGVTSGGGSEEDRTGAWERCRSLIDAMGRLGLEPDRLCYKHAVDSAAKVGLVCACDGDLASCVAGRGDEEAYEGVFGGPPWLLMLTGCGSRGGVG